MWNDGDQTEEKKELRREQVGVNVLDSLCESKIGARNARDISGFYINKEIRERCEFLGFCRLQPRVTSNLPILHSPICNFFYLCLKTLFRTERRSDQNGRRDCLAQTTGTVGR